MFSRCKTCRSFAGRKSVVFLSHPINNMDARFSNYSMMYLHNSIPHAIRCVFGGSFIEKFVQRFGGKASLASILLVRMLFVKIIGSTTVCIAVVCLNVHDSMAFVPVRQVATKEVLRSSACRSPISNLRYALLAWTASLGSRYVQDCTVRLSISCKIVVYLI